VAPDRERIACGQSITGALGVREERFLELHRPRDVAAPEREPRRAPVSLRPEGRWDDCVVLECPLQPSAGLVVAARLPEQPHGSGESHALVGVVCREKNLDGALEVATVSLDTPVPSELLPAAQALLRRLREAREMRGMPPARALERGRRGEELPGELANRVEEE